MDAQSTNDRYLDTLPAGTVVAHQTHAGDPWGIGSVLIDADGIRYLDLNGVRVRDFHAVVVLERPYVRAVA